jgi:hypothetical protein
MNASSLAVWGVRVALGAAAASGTILATGAWAGAGAMFGPPIICSRLDIGEARTIPEGESMSAKELVKQVAAALAAERSPLVHMETIRRASVLVAKTPEGQRSALGWELLGRSACQALEQEAAGTPDALAWFDAGFWAASLDQAGVSMGSKPGAADDVPGYAYARKALQLAHRTPEAPAAEMEFGAALMAHPGMRNAGKASYDPNLGKQQYDGHLALAAAGAPKGSLLEQNITAHFARFGGTLEKARAQAAADKPSK